MTDALTLDQVADRVRDLPPLPAIVMDLVASLGNDNLSSVALAGKLSRDPGLSAKALRIANSPFFGMSRQIDSISEALTILGLRTVRTLVMAAGMMDVFRKMEAGGFDARAFWRHAMGAALCGQILAKELGMDPDMGFTVGLLHDVGEVALACAFPEQHAQVLAFQRREDVLLVEAENAVLNTNHAKAGAMLLEHWSFSPVMVEAIENHHYPAMHHGPGLVGLAHMADAFSHALGLSGNAGEQVPPTPAEVWCAMAPDADRCMNLFAEVERQFEDVCHAIQV